MKTIFTTTRYGLKRIQISTKTDPAITPKPIKDDVPLLTSTEFFSFLGSIGLIYSFCIVLISLSILHPSEFIYGLSFSKEIFSIAKDASSLFMILFIYASVAVILVEKLKYIIDNYITKIRNRNEIIFIIFAIYLFSIYIYKDEIINYTNELYLILIALASSIYLFSFKSNTFFKILSIYTVLCTVSSLYVVYITKKIAPAINVTIFLTDGEQLKTKNVFIAKESLAIVHLDKGEIIIPLSRIKQIEKTPSSKKKPL